MTDDLQAMAEWLLACGVDVVALESTGVYWIPVYELLESRGLKVWRVDARQVKYVPGRKSDVADCQWLQKLMCHGLLRAAFRPAADVCVLRAVALSREVLLPFPDGAVDNDRHHHHDHHTVEVAGEAVVVDDVSGDPSPTSDADPIAVVEAVLVRLVDDVGVLAEEDVVRAFSILKATDLPSYLRLHHAAKKANHGCSVTVLDKLVRAELPASDDDASALDELVALARTQCQLHHDADRRGR